MRIAYHPAAQTVSRAAHDAWIVAALANLSASPGTVVTIPNPDHPWAFESTVTADDRTTLGGQAFSRLRYVRRTGEWKWTLLSVADAAQWRAVRDASAGFRFAVVAELPATLERVAIIGQGGSLVASRPLFYDVALSVREWLP